MNVMQAMRFMDLSEMEQPQLMRGDIPDFEDLYPTDDDTNVIEGTYPNDEYNDEYDDEYDNFGQASSPPVKPDVTKYKKNGYGTEDEAFEAYKKAMVEYDEKQAEYLAQSTKESGKIFGFDTSTVLLVGLGILGFYLLTQK